MERRLGPERYAEGIPWEGEILRLSEDVRRCVVLLGWQEAGPVDLAPIKPCGTGFFVFEGNKPPTMRAFIVTALHVANDLAPPFVIRVNEKGGGAKLIHIDRPTDIEWVVHDDPKVDLAVAPVLLPSWAEGWGINALGMDDDVKELEQIDAGDAACVVGLFHLLSGQRRNIPITHSGHVAMLPRDEMIPVGDSFQEGYLVQANAISGCSGAPVFAVRTVRLNLGKLGITGMHTKAPMLGVWPSSWKVKGSQIVSVGTPDGEGELAPLGMGVVTPLQKLVDIMKSEKLKQASDRLLKKVHKDSAATPDSLPKEDESASHQERFKRLLDVAVKRPKSSD